MSATVRLYSLSLSPHIFACKCIAPAACCLKWTSLKLTGKALSYCIKHPLESLELSSSRKTNGTALWTALFVYHERVRCQLDGTERLLNTAKTDVRHLKAISWHCKNNKRTKRRNDTSKHCWIAVLALKPTNWKQLQIRTTYGSYWISETLPETKL